MAQLPITQSHKTVFVLDKNPVFAKSSNQLIEYDVLLKSKTPGIIPAAPIPKSLWTCSVECMMEYIRIIYDLFPFESLIRVVSGTKSLNTWACKEQNLHQIMLGLAHIGAPSPVQSEEEYDIMHGLSQAVVSLCEGSEQELSGKNSSNYQNQGRIICFTTLKSESNVQMLEECVTDAINEHNKLTEMQDSLLPIDYCELVLIHVTPIGEELIITERPLKEVSDILSSHVITTESGRILYNRLIEQCQFHFRLSSTTVTGIPMKEEQNASSSANYDVELLHSANTHEELLKSIKENAQNYADGLVIASKEGLPTQTVTLKWCTPKTNVVELHPCSEVHRITPVDVNSRPSSCLTNFLLGGRAVMLEQPRKTGTKVISHMLACHGGEIYIHTIPTTRSFLEDPPSISEGCGGRVTDYRISDFGEFMKENRLAPTPSEMQLHSTDLPVDKAFTRMERVSRTWPMTISETIIFNMASIDPLPTVLVKDVLTDDDVLECKKAIFHVLNMESKNEALPLPVVGTRGKGPRREEQYRQMWAELEGFVRSHSSVTPNHDKVLECLLDCKKPAEDTKTKKLIMKEERMDTSDAEESLKEFDRFQKMTEKEKQDFLKTEPTDISPAKKIKTNDEPFMKMTGQNLMSIWTNRIKSVHNSRHQEFDGRLEEGDTAVLYKQLQEDAPMEGQK